ncbi:nucleotide exchange factor GrpE [Candidatus Sumerlaeota bacterium]|nr:nucleotide exchange factor GrpE [Candidatus Sumerlaeota bacterium]
MSQPPLHLNLMRRRKQQYRLRRRRFLVSNKDIFSPQLEAAPQRSAVASKASDADPDRLREKLRAAEVQAAKLHADLRAVDSLIKDYERRLLEKDSLIAQKDTVIAEATRVIEEAKAQLLRNRQDIDLQRKRLAKEKEDMKKYAVEEFLRQILSPLDHFTLAMEQWRTGAGTGHSLGEGMQMVFRELMASLEGNGLMCINTTGLPFDPTIHDAVSKCTNPARPDGEVVRILRPGYLLKDKVLRPAIVEVNKLPDGASHLSEPVALPPSTPPPAEEPAGPDAVVEVRLPLNQEVVRVDPVLQQTHSSPLDRARRMLETKFDDTGDEDPKG